MQDTKVNNTRYDPNKIRVGTVNLAGETGIVMWMLTNSDGDVVGCKMEIMFATYGKQPLKKGYSSGSSILGIPCHVTIQYISKPDEVGMVTYMGVIDIDAQKGADLLRQAALLFSSCPKDPCGQTPGHENAEGENNGTAT